ncbi:putative nuclease HARBI1 [Monomorium pharaonis]|uniref:putative nuclease HARBI1 n=1 Tax=Monomorium pharaonis TaxID=307658 RepID=UPI00102E1B7E|nr:putative nuclease HARBI1 [Monomorium pharaonis]
MATQRVRRNRILFSTTRASQKLLEILMRITDEIKSSESDDNFEEGLLIEKIRRIRGKQQKPVRIAGYVENVIPRYTTKQFRHHFRMLPEMFEILENRLGQLLLSNEPTRGRPIIPVRIQLLSTIWLLATPDSFRSVSEKFDLGKSSLNACVRRVVKALNSIANEIIKWPIGLELASSKEKFMHLGQTPLPGMIGAIDGSYIFIKKPDIEEVAIHYKCRKLQYAVVLQAICDTDLAFIDCFTGYPGSRSSQKSPRFFPEDEFIVGDKAYPCLTWCIPPFRNNGRLTQNQKIFNRVISQKRQVIERAFALLKGRFRRLKFLDMSRLDLIPFFIMAACVLHNICLKGIDNDIGEFIEEGWEPYEGEDNDDIVNPEYNDRRDEFDDGEIKQNYLCLRVAGRQ